MNMLSFRWCLPAMLAALVSLASCGDEKTQRRARTGGKTDEEKTAKTDGESPGKTVAAEGWGDLKGRFVVVGTAPAPKELTISQDRPYCDPFKAKGELHGETVVVSDKNELKNVIVYLRVEADEKLPIHDDYKATEKSEVVLDNHKCRFEPHITLLRTSQLLRIKNSDPMGHNTKVESFSQRFNEIIAANSPGVTRQLTHEERLPIAYGCNVHPWMSGHMLVLSHPYMAVSGDNGSFEIKNLPAGEREFQIWHEAPGYLEVGDWKKGRKKLTIEPRKPKDLGTIEVPAEKLKGA